MQLITRLNVAVRCVYVMLATVLTILPLLCVVTITSKRRATTRLSNAASSVLANILMLLGGLLPKIAQLLSTRSDIFSHSDCEILAKARSRPLRMQPIGLDLPDQVKVVAAIASGSVANVFAVTIGGKLVALKMLRAKEVKRCRSDALLMRALAKVAQNWVPSIPILAAMEALSLLLSDQLDGGKELRWMQRFHFDPYLSTLVKIPRPLDYPCSESHLFFELIEGLRQCDDAQDKNQDLIARRATRLLFAMIFRSGLLHCDLHPGNLRVTAEGDLVLLDFGLCTELSEELIGDFREFFWSLISQNYLLGASILIKHSQSMKGRTPDFAALRDDVERVWSDVSGASVGRFNVVSFVNNIFAIQSRNGLRGSPVFVLIITSILTLEGTLKRMAPDLDFQDVARETLLAFR